LKMSCAGDTMSKAMMDLTLGELKIECDTCTNEFGCGDCCVMEEIRRRKDIYARDMTDEELDFECLGCSGKGCQNGCKHCEIRREINYRGDRDVYHDGSLIKGGGVSRPEWMDNDQWGEYRMSADYAHEVSYAGFDEPEEDDYYG